MRLSEFINIGKEQTTEARTLAKGTPMQELIKDYKTFTSFNIGKLADYAVSGKENEVKSVVQRGLKSFKEIDLLKTDREKLQFIHDMITYMQPHMKAYLTPDAYNKFKPRIQTLANLYKDAVKSQTTESLEETIRHEGNKWNIYSKDGKKRLGSYDSKKAAKKRLQQIEYFKHESK